MGCENLLCKEGGRKKGDIEGGKEKGKNERKKIKKEEKIQPPKHAACPLGSDSWLVSGKPKKGERLENWERRQGACERRLSPLLVSASWKKALGVGVGLNGGR